MPAKWMMPKYSNGDNSNAQPPAAINHPGLVLVTF